MRITTLRFCALFLLLCAGIAAHGATAREQEAFDFLRTTVRFESPHIGFGGVYSRGYLALRIVSRSRDADALFKRLIREGTAAGQIYGLIGVYRTDPSYFRSVASTFASKRTYVPTMVGCIMGSERMGELVAADYALTVANGETLAQAFKRQPHANTDIAHGGYTAWYLSRDSDEREIVQAEAKADFARR
jgi:hypothetical protein